MEETSLCSVDKPSFPFFRSSASFFSSQYHILFLRSSRTCVHLLPTHFICHLSINCSMKKIVFFPLEVSAFSPIILRRRHMRISTNKSKVMAFHWKFPVRFKIKTRNSILGLVNSFRGLGYNLTN